MQVANVESSTIAIPRTFTNVSAAGRDVLDGHPCPASRLAGHFLENMAGNEIWRSPVSGNAVRSRAHGMSHAPTPGSLHQPEGLLNPSFRYIP